MNQNACIYNIFNFKIFLQLYPGLWLYLRRMEKNMGRDENEKGRNGRRLKGRRDK